ncbi:unnamed protein product [Allacma fusca]|uniref:Uncharacterized protein n=1 Tax=Allacma fusca TaxID=39272 RepID=A0A8J2KS45_9HEXA|nr:unnamed protein product [Allacma fusca]
MSEVVSCLPRTGTTNCVAQDRRSQNSRGSRVDSGSVDMETPQSLSPRSPLDALEALDASLPPLPNNSSPSSSGMTMMTNSAPLTSVMHHNIHNSNNNNNHVMISTPTIHPVPAPVPVTIPTPICISQAASPATPVEVMIGGAESTQSLNSDRRVPIVPPRRCRTRSPTPNTSKGES